MKEIISHFLNETIPDINSNVYNLSFIKFVFNNDALIEMSKYNEYTASYLKEIKENYDKGLNYDEIIYIKIEDYKKFFDLLKKIVLNYNKKKYKRLYNSLDIMRSIWLRMSPSDINDVNSFLEKQLSFLYYDDILPYDKSYFKKYDDMDIYYQNMDNEEWFETNNNITFSFVKNNNDTFSIYDLPSIHYAFNKENNVDICYIYGIQNISNEKNDIIKEKIKPLKKQLQNKYVSQDFVLSLKLFIDFLRENEIYTIKVPLLQVFNYQYHENLSKSVEHSYYSYENKEELEKKYFDGNRDDIVLD